jgi:hypothetical protein
MRRRKRGGGGRESYYDTQHQRAASFTCRSHIAPQQRYHYSDVVVGLVWSNDPNR